MLLYLIILVRRQVVHTFRLLLTQLSLATCYFLLLRSQHYPHQLFSDALNYKCYSREFILFLSSITCRNMESDLQGYDSVSLSKWFSKSRRKLSL